MTCFGLAFAKLRVIIGQPTSAMQHPIDDNFSNSRPSKIKAKSAETRYADCWPYADCFVRSLTALGGRTTATGWLAPPPRRACADNRASAAHACATAHGGLPKRRRATAKAAVAPTGLDTQGWLDAANGSSG
ncbi:MAG: hypothetical protein GY938_27615, partial [Ketobacter sp.]|nr:hypothetical protein [Ketobacter sp.]